MPQPWISRYDAGVPASVDYPEWTVLDLLRHSVERFPDSPALLFYGTRISYRDLDDLTTRLASALQRLGVVQGDRVALMLPNIPQSVIAYYGILKAGAIVVPTNPLYVEREILEQLADSGSDIIIALDLLYPRIQTVQTASAFPKRVILTSIRDFLPPLKKFLYPFKARLAKRWISTPTGPSIYDFLGLIDTISTDHGGPPSERLHIRSDDLAQLQYTGGTTGIPKGVMLTHRNVVVNALQGRVWDPHFRDGQELFLGAIPFFHCYGQSTCQNLAIATGCPILLLPRFHPDEVVKAIHKHRVTIFSGVPMMFAKMIDAAQTSRYDLRSLRVCLSGASPLPADVQERFEETTGVRIAEGYGLTEAGPTTHCNPLHGEHPPGSMGLPFPDTEARVVDADRGSYEVPDGEAGELIVRGPQVMRGYWNKEAETQAVLRDGWLHTGDLVSRNKEGFFFFVDRKKDIIKCRGETVYPREVEEVLLQHQAVAEAAVVGVADQLSGEIVKAYIVLKPGSFVTEQELIRHCARWLARYKIPSAVEFRQELPRTVIGKVLRRTMREEAVRTSGAGTAQHHAA
ncbi:MAG: long-chain fatty acid--CoA ligase [Nitrospira sp.]|nr:long-chain fatty acid--CoA ligase [Nitrospira sp.]